MLIERLNKKGEVQGAAEMRILHIRTHNQRFTYGHFPLGSAQVMVFNSPMHTDISQTLQHDALPRSTRQAKLFQIPRSRGLHNRLHPAAGAEPVLPG